MKIEPKYVTFEQAKLLSEKDFDEPCSHYYINDFQNFKHDGMLHKCGLPNECDSKNIFQYVRRKNQPHLCNAPEQWQVVEWLRLNYNIWISVDMVEKDSFFYSINKHDWEVKQIIFSDDFETPQEAYSAAFDYILKKLI